MSPTANKTATLYRMMMPSHICPSGLKALDLLSRHGYEVDDHHLVTREMTDAFKAEPKAAPKPHLGQNRRINNTKARGLSFGEMYSLGELQDVPFRDLPDWVRDGGYAEPSADEKRHQKEQFAETGLTQTERNLMFNAFAAQIDALLG